MTMTLIVRNSDSLVQYAIPDGSAVDLTASPAIIGSWLVGDVSSSTHAAVTGQTLPSDYAGGIYIFAAGVWTLTAAAIAARLPALMAAKGAAATAYFSALFAAPQGFTFSGHLYQIDQVSQMNVTAMGAEANKYRSDAAVFDETAWSTKWSVLPAGHFAFIASDNTSVAMTAATMSAFADAVAIYVAGSRAIYRATKTAIATAPDAATLAAIDVTAGYPTSSA